MADKITVKIKKLHPDATIPQYAHEGDAGFDLVAVEGVTIPPQETKLIPTGLAFEIPPGYEMQIRPRSGISGKTPLRIPNAPGTVDSTYRGEVKVLMENSSSVVGTPWGMKAAKACYIPKGNRIAQGVIKRVPRVELVEVDELSDTERGTGGFGSTGV